MKKKILIIFILLILFSISFVNIYAETAATPSSAFSLDAIISQGTNFTNNAVTSNTIGSEVVNFIKGENDNGGLIGVVSQIGELVFAAVTVILGMKYIWESAEGKAQILESLPGFVLAVIFFYLGKDLVEWLNKSNTGVLGVLSTQTTWNGVAGKIIWVINTIVKYGSFAGILVMGLRYMFAAADTRANLKSSFGGFAIGILLVFAASQVVNYIIDAAELVI